MKMPTWLTRMFDAPEQRNYMDLVMLGTPTYAGPQVDEESSLRSTAVYACVRIISESIASLPLVLYRRRGRNKERATDHPLYSILHDLPNPELTALEFREMLLAQVLLWGTAWAEIEYDKGGRIQWLWPLRSSQMEGAERRDGTLFWLYRLPGLQLRKLSGERVLVFRGLSGDGIFGYSPIKIAARQAVGISLATEEYGARFFSNGARPGGVLRHPGVLSPEAHKRLQSSFASDHGGLSNAHRMKILEEGMDYTQIGIPPEEAQFLETRKFQVTDIARVFRVPPHMLADLERATFSNIEHQSLEFVMHTLRPWMVRFEQVINRDLLLNSAERQQYFARHTVEGLLRGDTASRYQSYATAVVNGWMTRNEVRELEDMNTMDGLDEFLLPLNMIEAGQEPVEVERQLMPDSETRNVEIRQDRIRTINRFVRLFEEAANRLVRRETADIRRAANRFLGKRTIGEFREWLEGFYQDLRGVIPGYFESILFTLSEEIFETVAEELDIDAPDPENLDQWITEFLRIFSEIHAVGGEKQLRTLLEEAENEEQAADLVLERMDGWDGNRASKIGLEQAYEAGNALAILGYVTAGVGFLVWSGGDCPICRRLNGRRIPIDGAFAQNGDIIEPDDDDTAPYPVIRTIKHGPLHRGCDCIVRAG